MEVQGPSGGHCSSVVSAASNRFAIVRASRAAVGFFSLKNCIARCASVPASAASGSCGELLRLARGDRDRFHISAARHSRRRRSTWPVMQLALQRRQARACQDHLSRRGLLIDPLLRHGPLDKPAAARRRTGRRTERRSAKAWTVADRIKARPARELAADLAAPLPSLRRRMPPFGRRYTAARLQRGLGRSFRQFGRPQRAAGAILRGIGRRCRSVVPFHPGSSAKP